MLWEFIMNMLDLTWYKVAGMMIVVLLVISLVNRVGGDVVMFNDYTHLIPQLIPSGAAAAGRRSPKGPRLFKREEECRDIFEQLFAKPFPKLRVLRNPVTKENLELDGYNEELKLAFEYNGRQHYHYTPYFHRNVDMFRTTQYRDVLKQQEADKACIKLVVIPYTTKNLVQFIKSQV